MKEELVSIAMATYNGERFLKEQLDSIYNQSYGNIEVIVSDDCSSDGTIDILDHYNKTHGLEYSVNDKNVGVWKNFEKVISMCEGKYIALADQDDIWLPKKISQLVEHIGKYSLAYSDASLIDEEGNLFSKSLQEYSKVPVRSGKSLGVLLFHNFVTGCLTLVKRDLVKKSLPIPASMPHDWWLGIVASRMEGYIYVNKALVQYRQHENNNLGAIKMNPLWKLLINPIKEKKRLKAETYEKSLKRMSYLTEFIKYPFFTPQDKKLITDAIMFHKDYLNTTFHLKRFLLGIKYRKFIYYSRSPLQQLLMILNNGF